jgi:hypothetical protein
MKKQLYLFVLFLLSCEIDYSANQSGFQNNKYLLLEIKRHADGELLDESYGSVDIDFAGYSYDIENKKLDVYRVVDSAFKKGDPFKLICALERTLGGELGGGTAGGVLPINQLSTIVPIMTFPLEGQDSLFISHIDDAGRIEFAFREHKAVVAPGQQWQAQTRDSLKTFLGRFKIDDRVTLINHGLLNTADINW